MAETATPAPAEDPMAAFVAAVEVYVADLSDDDLATLLARTRPAAEGDAATTKPTKADGGADYEKFYPAKGGK